MKGAEILPMLTQSLIRASQLSFLENAPGTHSILKKLNTILRYTERRCKEARCSEEWSIVKTYLELQRIQSPDRFSFKISGGEVCPEFVVRGSWLREVDRIFNRENIHSPNAFCLELQLLNTEIPRLKVNIVSGGESRAETIAHSGLEP